MSYLYIDVRLCLHIATQVQHSTYLLERDTLCSCAIYLWDFQVLCTSAVQVAHPVCDVKSLYFLRLAQDFLNTSQHFFFSTINISTKNNGDFSTLCVAYFVRKNGCVLRFWHFLCAYTISELSAQLIQTWKFH